MIADAVAIIGTQDIVSARSTDEKTGMKNRDRPRFSLPWPAPSRKTCLSLILVSYALY